MDWKKEKNLSLLIKNIHPSVSCTQNQWNICSLCLNSVARYRCNYDSPENSKLSLRLSEESSIYFFFLVFFFFYFVPHLLLSEKNYFQGNFRQMRSPSNACRFGGFDMRFIKVDTESNFSLIYSRANSPSHISYAKQEPLSSSQEKYLITGGYRALVLLRFRFIYKQSYRIYNEVLLQRRQTFQRCARTLPTMCHCARCRNWAADAEDQIQLMGFIPLSTNSFTYAFTYNKEGDSRKKKAKLGSALVTQPAEDNDIPWD